MPERSLRRIKRKIRKFLGNRTPLPVRIAFFNLSNALRGRSVRFVLKGRSGIIQAKGNSVIHFCRAGRFKRYTSSTEYILEVLEKDYHLSHIREEGGTFIDCGANVGELGLWARRKRHEYIAFEPEELEADCCDLNNFAGERKTQRKALWFENDVLTFYSKPNSADGSLFAIKNAVGTRQVEAVRLDSVIDPDQLRSPVIVKVEAEGAEPEVLKGLEGLAGKIDFVAIDCGYERGLEQEHTFLQSHRLLEEYGFEILAAGFKRVTLLYGRKTEPA
jgi:FkbM family methyltransferase